MLKTILFDGGLNNENVQALIDDIQQPHMDDKETDVVLYFSSEGGFRHSTQALIECINTLPEEYNFKMVFYWRVHSSAFDVLVNVNCRKEIQDGARWGNLYHSLNEQGC